MPTLHDYVAVALSAFRIPRGDKMIHAGGRAMTVRTATEKRLLGPDGRPYNISVDDSGVATQIEDDAGLSAIVRPHPILLELRTRHPDRTVSSRVRPRSIRTTAIPRR